MLSKTQEQLGIEDLMIRAEAAIPPTEYEENNQIPSMGDIIQHPESMEGAYENCAEYAVKIYLRAYERDPEKFCKALMTYKTREISEDIDKTLSPEEYREVIEGRWGLSGFQWGWVINTVLKIIGETPIRNPAIFSFSTHQGELNDSRHEGS